MVRTPPPLVEATTHGLYCAAGDFHIDPWRPVERAVVTHAHSDHATPGCGRYLCAPNCEPALRLRMGSTASIDTLAFGDAVDLQGVRVSLHSAGHILGSAQVRVEHGGEVWVVSGDYRPDARPTVEPFEPVSCHVFISECTFGLPVYRWVDEAEVFADLNDWWRSNQSIGRTSFVHAYALGKAQRILAGLDPSIGPIAAHGSVMRLNAAYEECGVKLPAVEHATRDNAKTLAGRGLIVAPPSTAGSVWERKFNGPEGSSSGFASGWMRIRGRRRWRAIDRGFVVSDHADWPGLLDTIDATGAERVGLTHGSVEPLKRFLMEERSIDAFVVPTRYTGESDDPKSSADEVGDDSPNDGEES
ncbi:MAG: ligase-associated DNA damage response exonuclease [Phycisphaerales bacterium]